MARTDQLLKRLRASRLDGTHDSELRRLIRLEVLVLDDFCLQALDETDTTDLYELIVERHRRATTIVTTNREPPGEWLAAMADPCSPRPPSTGSPPTPTSSSWTAPPTGNANAPAETGTQAPLAGGQPHPREPANAPPPASRPSPPGGLRPALTPAHRVGEGEALDPRQQPDPTSPRAKSWPARRSHAPGKPVVPSRWQATPAAQHDVACRHARRCGARHRGQVSPCRTPSRRVGVPRPAGGWARRSPHP